MGANLLQAADVDIDLAHGLFRLIKPLDCANSALAYWAQDGNYSDVRLSIPEHGVGSVDRPIFVASATTSL